MTTDELRSTLIPGGLFRVDSSVCMFFSDDHFVWPEKGTVLLLVRLNDAVAVHLSYELKQLRVGTRTMLTYMRSGFLTLIS